MPALKAIVSADASQFNAELRKAEQYSNWWAQKLTARDVEIAERSNKARRLVRERSAGREAAAIAAAEVATAGSVEAASRRNRARQLLRERAERRASALAESAKDYAIVASPAAIAAAGNAVEKTHLPVRLLKKELKYLGGAFGEIAHIAIYSFKSPIMWAIGGVIAGLYGLHKWFQFLSPKADTLGTKSLAPQMEHFTAKVIESKAALAKWFDEFSRGRTELEKLNEAMKDQQNIATAWGKSEEQIIEAQKEMALARAGNNRFLRAQIENTYELQKIERENKRRNEERALMRDTADKAEAESKRKASEVSGLSAAALEADRQKEANAERIKNAEDNVKMLRKKRQELGAAGFARTNGFGALRVNEDVLASATAAQPGLVAAAEKAGDALKRAEKEAMELRKDADDKRRDVDRKMVESAAQYKADKEAHALRVQTRMILPEVKANLNALQKQGAYAGGGNLLDVNKRMERHLATLVVQNQRRSVDQTQPRF